MFSGSRQCVLAAHPAAGSNRRADTSRNNDPCGNARLKRRKSDPGEKLLFRKLVTGLELEVEANPNLPFAAGQTLQRAAKHRRSAIEALHRGDVALIEEVEEFE